MHLSTLIESLGGSVGHGTDEPVSEGSDSTHRDSLEDDQRIDSGDDGHELGVLRSPDTHRVGQESSAATPVGSNAR